MFRLPWFKIPFDWTNSTNRQRSACVYLYRQYRTDRLLHSYSISHWQNTATQKNCVRRKSQTKESVANVVVGSRHKPLNIAAVRCKGSIRRSHCQRLSIPAKWTGQVNALRCLSDFSRTWISLDFHSPFQYKMAAKRFNIDTEELWDCKGIPRPIRFPCSKYRLFGG